MVWHFVATLLIYTTLVHAGADLNFEPATQQTVVLVSKQTQVVSGSLRLRNSGTSAVDVRLQAQCDASLSPHQSPWISISLGNFTLAPSAQDLSVDFSGASLLPGVYSTRICAFDQSETDASSGLSPVPLAQVAVQATVLCSRFAQVNTSQDSCSVNVTQLALFKAPNQPTSVFFEANVAFNQYPWPLWSSAADVNGSVTVDQGQGSIYNLTLWPPGNSCGTYLVRGTTPVATAGAASNSTHLLKISINAIADGLNSANATLVTKLNKTATNASACMLQQKVDTASLPLIGQLPFWPPSTSAWSPTVSPFSLLPTYLVAGSGNGTASATLTLNNSRSVEHSVQIVTDCYNETGAGIPISWLTLSQQDILVPANGFETIGLTYNANGLAAGTYRAQLCLFSDYSYGSVSSVVQVQLIVLCSRYSGYQTFSPGCDITFSNIIFTGASPSSPSSPSSSASSSSSPSSSPVNFDGDGESLDPQASTALGVASPDPQAASSSPPAASPSGGGAGQGASFSGVVAFDRPVVGAQSLQSLAGMMYSGGLSNGRISTVTEDTSQGLNCGMYNIAGYVLGTTDGSQANITVSVAGLYDVTNKMNSCSVQAVY